MKNKKIYRILTVILLTVTIFSLICTNVCAFSKLNNCIEDIPGEREYDTPYYSIYNDDYALIDCGRIDRELTHVPGENVSWNDFVTLPRLQAFLSDMTDENAKYGKSYSKSDLNYVEFLVLDDFTGLFVHSGDILKVGETQSQYFQSGIRVLDRITWQNELRFSFMTKFTDAYYYHYEQPFGVPEWSYSLYAVCYFGDYNPYGISDAEAGELRQEIALLNIKISKLEGQIKYYEENENSNSAIVESLRTQVNELTASKQLLEATVSNQNSAIKELSGDNATLKQEKNELSDYISILERDLFEKENANAIDEIFTGTAQGLLSIIQGVSGLGYTTAGGTTVTIGGLLVVAILGAVIVFFLKLILGGGS